MVYIAVKLMVWNQVASLMHHLLVCAVLCALDACFLYASITITCLIAEMIQLQEEWLGRTSGWVGRRSGRAGGVVGEEGWLGRRSG